MEHLPGARIRLQFRWRIILIYLTSLETSCRGEQLRKVRKYPKCSMNDSSSTLAWSTYLHDREFLRNVIECLETHDEQPGDSWSRPNLDVAAWTAFPQSTPDEPYNRVEDDFKTVTRSDLMRCRVEYRMSDADGFRYGWQPVGSIKKTGIEIDLWPRLEFRIPRRYQNWIWWDINTGTTRRREDDGFGKKEIEI